MTTNIAIVANYNKTLFFKKIADQLESQKTDKNDIQVFWICVSTIWYEWLAREGVPKERILFLPRSIVGEERDGNQPERTYHYRLNELIYSDRVFRYECDFGEKYLLAIQPRIRDFIQTHKLRYIFGESTWAHEVLLNRMCLQEKALHCTYLKPHTIRIPNQRFAFFTDEFESQLHEVSNGEEKDWPFELKKPDYFHLNDQKNKLMTRVLGLFRNIKLALSPEKHDRQDPTQRLSRTRFFTSKIVSELNYYVYKFFVKTSKIENLPERFWVYYLHKQPEASIDIVGRYFEDQYANILRLTRMLPDDTHLLVKEHSNAIGDRPYGFYKKVKALNRVDLIDEGADSFILIERAEKTVTVSGTVAYEAGLLGKEAFIFSQAFFAALPTVESALESTLESTKEMPLTEFKMPKADSKMPIADSKMPIAGFKMSIANFKRHLYKHSFPGVISDPISDIRCVAPENIQQVAAAFRQVIHHDK
ncbi:hypothetical protein CBF23_014575 [Marinomonas agarivorans]|nr:hypothetical protein CBF23_014575 [Marinomonas agarivorans]